MPKQRYIPILKWKAAEQEALERIDVKDKEFISPLIQVVMPDPKSPKKGEPEKSQDEQIVEVVSNYKVKITKIPEEVLNYWGRKAAFIDFSLVYTPSLRVEGLTQVLTLGRSLGLVLIPVVNLSDSETMKAAASLSKRDGFGLCLRLVCADLSNLEELAQKIDSFLQNNTLSEKDVDILIDLKETYKNEDKYNQFRKVSQKIPNLEKWRSFIFASGAFPVDLNDCELGENYIPRSDWNEWEKQTKSKELKRHPTFADYTIQHPIYKESARFFSPSASIRYTLNDKWLVMRGQKGKFSQYLANASLLSNHTEFLGEEFSYGDKFINAKGKDINSNKPGNAKNWLTAGISHHIAIVVSQLSRL